MDIHCTISDFPSILDLKFEVGEVGGKEQSFGAILDPNGKNPDSPRNVAGKMNPATKECSTMTFDRIPL